MEFVELDINMTQEDMESVVNSSSHYMKIANMNYDFRGKDNFDILDKYIHTENLHEDVAMGTLTTPAGRDSKAHQDIYRIRDENGNKIDRYRHAAINIPYSVSDKSYVAYIDKETKENLNSYYFGKPILMKTDEWHKAYNKESDIDRVIISVSFFTMTFDELKSLHERGMLVR